MATIRELLTSWGFDIDTKSLDDMDRRVDNVRKKTDAFGKNLDRLSTNARATGTQLSLFLTAPILGIGAAMIKAASDAEETEAKFATVFQDISEESEITAKNLARNFGLASDKSKELLGDTGDLLTGFGFTGKMALGLSKDVQELAVDLASFTNFAGGAEGASKALTKALLGERESVKSLGISILEEDVKAKIIALKASGQLTDESERQQKAIATLAIAVEQSKNAIGDYARTSEGFANQQRLAGQRVRELAITFGKILLPPALKILKVIIDLVEKFTDLEDSTKKTVLVVAGLVAAVGPLILLLGLLGGAIIAIHNAWALLKAGVLIFRALTVASLLAQASFLLIPLAIVAAIAIFALFIDDVISFFKGQDSLIGNWIGNWSTGFNDIKDFFRGISIVAELVFADLTNLLRDWADGANERFVNFKNNISKMGASIKKILRPLTDFLAKFATPFQALFKTAKLEFGGDEGLISQAGSFIASPFKELTAIGRGAGVSGGTSSSTKSINVNANISVAVPEGTPEAQVTVVREAAKLAAEEVFNEKLRVLASEGPEIE